MVRRGGKKARKAKAAPSYKKMRDRMVLTAYIILLLGVVSALMTLLISAGATRPRSLVELFVSNPGILAGIALTVTGVLAIFLVVKAYTAYLYFRTLEAMNKILESRGVAPPAPAPTPTKPPVPQPTARPPTPALTPSPAPPVTARAPTPPPTPPTPRPVQSPPKPTPPPTVPRPPAPQPTPRPVTQRPTPPPQPTPPQPKPTAPSITRPPTPPQPPTTGRKTCPYCGRVLPFGELHTVCPYCGRRLK